MIARRRPAALLSSLAAGAAVLTSCTSDGRPAPSSAPTSAQPTPRAVTVDTRPLRDPHTVPWQEARAVDGGMEVFFVGSASGCLALANVRVAETADAVTVTVFLGYDPALAPDATCLAVGESVRTYVPLAAPLGERQVLDGSSSPSPAPRPVNGR